MGCRATPSSEPLGSPAGVDQCSPGSDIIDFLKNMSLTCKEAALVPTGERSQATPTTKH